MKIKYFLLFVVSFFAIEFKVNALTCDYNVSGYKEDPINWSLDMDTGTAKMKQTLNVLMHDTNSSEDIINWENSSYSYNAKGSSCPKYLIQSKGLNCLGPLCVTDNRMFAADESTLNTMLSENEVQKNTHREVHVMQLATRRKENTKGATCKYSGSFSNSYFGIETGLPIEINLYYDGNGNLLSLDSNMNQKYGSYVIVSYSVYNTKIPSETCNASMAICQATDNANEHTHFGSYTFYLSGVDRNAEDRYSHGSNDKCETFKLSTDSTDSSGNTVTSGEYCPSYDTYWGQTEIYAKEYKTCVDADRSDCSKSLQKFNKEVEKLQTICKSAYSSMNYGDSCVNKCVKELENNLSQLKKDNKIYSQSNNEKCGLTSRLLNWIMKIINWLRYIVPVLLIILSILDFIKAIAADNEDEVKKVTSKFVKRLIVAVIIFLLPLALEFLLGIFGIDVNNFCL